MDPTTTASSTSNTNGRRPPPHSSGSSGNSSSSRIIRQIVGGGGGTTGGVEDNGAPSSPSSSSMLWHPSTNTYEPVGQLLDNKVVLLYFSASWCGPCQRFTPLLKELYRKLKSRDEMMEVVYCSMDKSEEQYVSYTNQMPWYCLPFRSPVLGILANSYGCEGIPHLVVLDCDESSTILVRDGIGNVTIDSDGNDFPWRPKPLHELLPNQYLGPDKQLHPISELDDKYLLLYFSAHWCPPCQRFTPLLSKAYLDLKDKRGDDFEILFVSSDHDPAAFRGYFGEMTFGAIPYEDRKAKAALAERLHIQGIPTLVIFGPRPAHAETDCGGVADRPLINTNVRAYFEQGDYLTEFPFTPKAYCDVNKTTDNINARKCIIIFHEGGDDDEQNEIRQLLIDASKQYRAAQCGDEDDEQCLHFYWALQSTGLTKTLRDALKLGPIANEPTMVLLDVPDDGTYYVSDCRDITSSQQILDFLASPGTKRKL